MARQVGSKAKGLTQAEIRVEIENLVETGKLSPHGNLPIDFMARVLLPHQPEIARRGIENMAPGGLMALSHMIRRQLRPKYMKRPPVPPPTTGPIKGDVHLTIVREEFL